MRLITRLSETLLKLALHVRDIASTSDAYLSRSLAISNGRKVKLKAGALDLRSGRYARDPKYRPWLAQDRKR